MSFLLNYFILWIIMHYEKKENKDLPDYMTNGKDTIAIRMATSKSIENLILKLGCPVFMTSANQSGEKECANLDEIKILREGPISIERIKEKLKINVNN